MASEQDESRKRWTAKRCVALIVEILRGDTSVVEAARKHGLTVADIEEWSRAPWSCDTAGTYQHGLYKAVWAQQTVRTLAAGHVNTRAYRGTAQEYVASLPYDYTLPLAISAVDTPEVRLQIQDTLPRQILNAGSMGTVAEVSVHTFGKGACFGCLGLETELDAWNAQGSANALGLTPERVYQLIQQNEEMTVDELEQDQDTAAGGSSMAGAH